MPANSRWDLIRRLRVKQGKTRYPSFCSDKNYIFETEPDSSQSGGVFIFETEPDSSQSEGVFISLLSVNLWMEEVLNFRASI